MLARARRDATYWPFAVPPDPHRDPLMTVEEALARLAVEKDFIPVGNSNRPGTVIKATHITIHNTDNLDAGADARMHALYVKGPDARKREVSWHFTVDDVRCVQHLPTNEMGWHAGKGNVMSVAIEVCQHASIDQEAANERAALLTAVLMLELAVKKDDVVPHQFWTGKNCPKVIMQQPGKFPAFVDSCEKLRGQITTPAFAETRAALLASRAVELATEAETQLAAASVPTSDLASRVALLEQLLGRKELRIAELERELLAARSLMHETA